MRRIISTAVAALLLAPAASASAAVCVNEAAAPNGFAFASSTHASGLYPVRGVNNGVLESGASQGYWNDNTNGVWPDWVGVGFIGGTRTLQRIVVKIPTIQPGFPVGETTLGRVRVQYWDAAAGSYRDVTGAAGQDNPIVDWHGPLTADGSEARTFDLATPITTSTVRVLIEEGSSDGWSWLAELETYDCLPNLALTRHGGTAVASSEAYPGTTANLNDGYGGGQNWYDGTPGVFPDWAGIEWRTARTLDRVVLQGPLLRAGAGSAEQIMHQTRVQYWDAATSSWSDVAVTGAGQSNPLVDWAIPTAPSSDAAREAQFDFTPVTTTRIRALIEDGNGYRSSVLDEIKAFQVR